MQFEVTFTAQSVNDDDFTFQLEADDALRAIARASQYLQDEVGTILGHDLTKVRREGIFTIYEFNPLNGQSWSALK